MSNTSGYNPYDIGVLVRINPPQEKKTSGGIILQANVDAVNIEAVQCGELIATGKLAFSGVEDPPQIGDQVFFAKYSGQFLYSYQTNDEKNYRVMDSHDIRLIRSK